MKPSESTLLRFIYTICLSETRGEIDEGIEAALKEAGYGHYYAQLENSEEYDLTGDLGELCDILSKDGVDSIYSERPFEKTGNESD